MSIPVKLVCACSVCKFPVELGYEDMYVKRDICKGGCGRHCDCNQRRYETQCIMCDNPIIADWKTNESLHSLMEYYDDLARKRINPIPKKAKPVSAKQFAYKCDECAITFWITKHVIPTKVDESRYMFACPNCETLITVDQHNNESLHRYLEYNRRCIRE